MKNKNDIKSTMPITTESNEVAALKRKIDLLSYVEKLAGINDLPFINKYKPPKRIQDEVLKSFKKWVSEYFDDVSGVKAPTSVTTQENVTSADKPQQPVALPFTQMEIQVLKQLIGKVVTKASGSNGSARNETTNDLPVGYGQGMNPPPLP